MLLLVVSCPVWIIAQVIDRILLVVCGFALYSAVPRGSDEGLSGAKLFSNQERRKIKKKEDALIG